MQSNRKWLGSVCVAFIALVGIAPKAEAQTVGGPKANVAVRITPTRQSDRPGGASVSSDFVAGESKRLNLTAGEGNDLCVTGVWAAEPGVVPGPEFKSRIGAQEAAALYVWRFDVDMREVATDRIVFISSGSAYPVQRPKIRSREGNTSSFVRGNRIPSI